MSNIERCRNATGGQLYQCDTCPDNAQRVGHCSCIYRYLMRHCPDSIDLWLMIETLLLLRDIVVSDGTEVAQAGNLNNRSVWGKAVMVARV